MNLLKMHSLFWQNVTGIEVLDPDGWDRRNFEESWQEAITLEEFMRRASKSTCKNWPAWAKVS